MAKRALGLGKASKAKKQKKPTEEESGVEATNEITVELKEEADADDELAQLQALWKTYYESDRDNELVLNGIVHECDRLLRNGNEREEQLPDFFYSIYGLALSELSNFHPDEVEEYFKEGLDRIELGMDKEENKESIILKFAKAKISLLQLSLQHVSKLTLESKGDNNQIIDLLDAALKEYESGESIAEKGNNYELFNQETFDIFESLDDILDIIDNFGSNDVEDDEEEDEEEKEEDNEDDEEDNELELPRDHPLFAIRNTDKYYQWWREHVITFLANLDKSEKKPSSSITSEEEERLALRREVCRRIGQSYLREAEVPTTVYTTLSYDEDFEGIEEYQGLTLKQAQGSGQKLIKQALEYLTEAEDKDDAETWVTVAEAMISLGNLYEVDSKDQELYYKSAEEKLKKANISTNGKYEDILENLLDN